MLTYDLTEVRGFTSDLGSRIEHCENGEGFECATLDVALDRYAELCREFIVEVRRWARGVFTGRVAFDPEVERLWKTEGARLYARSFEMWRHGQAAQVPCYEFGCQPYLQAALGELYRLLKGWVTPQLAVGPSARNRLALDQVASEEVRRKIASLPPLPAGWQPDDPRQQALFKMSRPR